MEVAIVKERKEKENINSKSDSDYFDVILLFLTFNKYFYNIFTNDQYSEINLWNEVNEYHRPPGNCSRGTGGGPPRRTGAGCFDANVA